MPAASPVPQDRRPPGPPLRRGLAQNLRYYAAFATDPTGFVEQRFKQYGDIYYAPATDGGLYVLKHPDHLRDLLITHAASYRKTHTAFRRLSPFLGDEQTFVLHAERGAEGATGWFRPGRPGDMAGAGRSHCAPAPAPAINHLAFFSFPRIVNS